MSKRDSSTISEEDNNNKKKQKTENNVFVNLLSNKELDKVVTEWFTCSYTQKKGKKRKNSLQYPTPFLVQDEHGNIWANPYAFSSTVDFFNGYPTMPVKLSKEVEQLYAPASTNKKSSWQPRVPVHCILYRWYNGYKTIPESTDISHLAGNKWVVTPTQLFSEDPILNRSRDACHKFNWQSEKKETCNNCVRCPHEPVCWKKVENIDLSKFNNSSLKPLGEKEMENYKPTPTSTTTTTTSTSTLTSCEGDHDVGNDEDDDSKSSDSDFV
jgi:hypothetical protein